MQLVDTLVIIYDTHAHYPGDGEQRFPLVGSERFWSSNLCQNNRPMHFLQCSTTRGECRRLRLPGVSSDLDKYLPQYEHYAKTAAAPPFDARCQCRSVSGCNVKLNSCYWSIYRHRATHDLKQGCESIKGIYRNMNTLKMHCSNLPKIKFKNTHCSIQIKHSQASSKR